MCGSLKLHWAKYRYDVFYHKILRLDADGSNQTQHFYDYFHFQFPITEEYNIAEKEELNAIH